MISNRRRRPLLRSGASERLWLVLAAVAVAASAAAQDEAATRQPATSRYTYDIPLFREDYPLYNPTNTWTYFFELRPGVRLLNGNSIKVFFRNSSTILKGQGSITVLLNNVPVASRTLLNTPKVTSWNVNLPLERFKSGFNELRIVTRQRSLDGPCEDLDNQANFVVLDRRTQLHLIREDKPTFPIAAYPFPYLDTLEANPVRSAIVLNSQPTDKHISEMLEMASDWGKKESTKSLPVRVTTAEPGGPAVLLGGSSSDAQGGAFGENVGFLRNFSRTGVPGSSRMLVTGANETGLDRAREALARPEMVEQISGTTASIPNEPAPDPARDTTKVGTFTFSDLGIPVVHLSGAFHQAQTIVIQRPLRADLGKTSEIKFKFRHSASLNPLRSILSIYLNGVPIASARLEPGNANGGEIIARIPVEELTKSRWVFDLRAYHDLAAVDCSKTYDDVAWTVIEGASAVTLQQGSLTGRPYLDGFPYLIDRDGKAPSKVVMSLPQNPNETILSAAGTIAARASQVNRTPLDWEARTNGDTKNDGSTIAIGYYSEASRFGSLGDDLLVAPTGNGTWKINPKINIVPSALENAAVLQAVKQPGNDKAVLYVLLAANDNALRVFTQALNNPEKAAKMQGEVVVVTADGHVVSMSTAGDQQSIRAEQEREKQAYTPPMEMIRSFIVTAILIAIVAIASSFRRNPNA